MNLQELISLQNKFDEKHNWISKKGDFDSLVSFLNRDLVGLFGEIGELANIIKKMNLDYDAEQQDIEVKFKNIYKPLIEEELVDSFIYLIRIANHLNLDLEKNYLQKLKINDAKFKKYEK